MHMRPFRHLEIDRVRVPASMAVSPVVPLRNRIRLARRKRQRINLRFVMLHGEVPPRRKVGVRPICIGILFHTRQSEKIGAALRRDRHRARESLAASVVGKLRLNRYGHVRRLQILYCERRRAPSLLVANAHQLLAREGIENPCRGEQEHHSSALERFGFFQHRHFEKLEKKGTPAEEEASAEQTSGH